MRLYLVILPFTRNFVITWSCFYIRGSGWSWKLQQQCSWTAGWFLISGSCISVCKFRKKRSFFFLFTIYVVGHFQVLLFRNFKQFQNCSCVLCSRNYTIIVKELYFRFDHFSNWLHKMSVWMWGWLLYLVVNQAVLETVARVKSTKKNETKEEKYTIQFYLSFIFIWPSMMIWNWRCIKRYLIFRRHFQLHDVFNLNNDNRAEDTPTLIDRKVSFCTGRLRLDLLY